MVQRAEIEIPDGITLGDLQGALSPMGGKVLGIRNLERDDIRTKEEPHVKLSGFIRSKGIELPPAFQAQDIFQGLKGLPKDRQEEILAEYYTQNVKDFPNGEEFAKGLVRLANMDYLNPELDPDLDELQILAREHLSRLNLSPEIPVRFIKSNWEEAFQTGLITKSIANFDLQTAIDVDPYTHLQIPRMAEWAVYSGTEKMEEAEGEKASRVVSRIVKDLINYAIWPVAQDEMTKLGYGKTNPFEPIAIMAEKYGCFSLGIIEKESSKEVAIFIPSAK
jgi:hypothetical protein